MLCCFYIMCFIINIIYPINWIWNKKTRTHE